MSKEDTKSKEKGKIIKFYTILPKAFRSDNKKDPSYEKTLIKKNSMCLVVGGTGAGKSNLICKFLKLSDGTFFDIIVYTGSSKDEELYTYLHTKIEGLQLIDEPSKLPMIEDYKDDQEYKKVPKCIIFDDCIMEDKKTLQIISKWYMCARKLGWTCSFLSQNYHSTPVFIRRNIMYLMLFKLTDVSDAKKILSKCCMDIDLDTLKNMLNYCTNENLNWLTISMKDPMETRYRRNFDDILDPNKFK
jgi:hypothetical protein